MRTVTVRNVKIGEGMPKICVPITGITKEEILREAEALKHNPVDLVEWRVDWFASCFDKDAIQEVGKQLREQLLEIPILFTFRTAKEGGETQIEENQYQKLLLDAIQTGQFDLVDIELLMGEEIINPLIKKAKEEKVITILSNHDFYKTPQKEEMISTLKKMEQLGADIAKIAVMPKSKQDVLTLLLATEEVNEKEDRIPIITMSMAGDGVISRLCGEVFGSAVTFGCMEKASAPGQVKAEQLHTVLEILHNAMSQ